MSLKNAIQILGYSPSLYGCQLEVREMLLSVLLLEDWLGDLDIDRLYDPAADEATLASNPATGSGDMRFDHWFEDQYWADETDGGE